MFKWDLVETELEKLIDEIGCSTIKSDSELKRGLRYGQEFAVRSIVKKLKEHGAILADEVGLGKTRVALLLMEAVLRAGGTVAAVVPRGLIYQWENEANDFAKTINDPQISKKIVKLTKFEDLFGSGTEYPIAKKNSWPLISQRFGMFSSRTKNLRRFDIFGMIANKLRGGQNRNNWKRYIELIENDEGYSQKSVALEFLNRKGLERYKSLKELKSPINRNKENNNVLQFIVKNKGKNDSKKIIGDLIGPIDFLVIDEAHKEKGGLSNEKVCKRESTNLESLLIDVIKQPSSQSRKLGMTATPIELNVTNWMQLLSRCGIESKDIKENVLKDFDICLSDANKNPDNPQILKKLIKASRPFQNFLGEYIVRRRRCNQEEHRILLNGLNATGKAHPYRRTIEKGIDIESLTMSWQKAILCYEGANNAALGADVNNHSDKFLRRNSAVGLIDIDKDESNENVIDPKERRRIFWKNLGNKYARSDNAGMAMHPKVQAAANLIEQLLDDENEKVLVFGTFNKPMRELRDELNWRNYARKIENGKILKNDIVSNQEKFFKIYEVYKRLYPNGKSLKDFEINANNLHEKYRQLQKKLQSITQGKDEDILNALTLKKGKEKTKEISKLFRKIKNDNPEVFKQILDCLRIDVLNYFVDKDVFLEESSFEQCTTTQEILGCFCETMQGYMKDVCDANSPLNEDAEDVDGNLLDNLKRYIEMFNNDDEYKSSVLCRLMNGDTEWNTRRRLQRQFNTENCYPRVLIAQSMVGREGLNLHKCCRKVVLIHPEWNPGVVEQQIGRVDRIDSLWNRLVESWQSQQDDNKSIKTYPYIEVYYIVFKGTYDQHQFEILKKRSTKVNAQLFGALLHDDALEKVPEDMKEELIKAAPDFDPCKKRNS